MIGTAHAGASHLFFPSTTQNNMKNIIRTFAIAAALACAAGTAAQGQTPAPEARAGSSGLHLGVFVNETVVRGDYEGWDGWDHGLGVGLHVGYQYTPEASVFARVNLAKGQEADLTQADLGLRLSFGRTDSALRPFAQGALGVRTADIGSIDQDIRGLALTVGGGVEYFVSRTVAIEGGLSLSGGLFTHGRSGDGGWDPVEGNTITAFGSRLDIGISWHP